MLPSEPNYYLVDAPEASTLTEHISSALSKEADASGGELIAFALLDQAFDYGGKPLAISLPAERLYCHGRWAQLLEAGPVMIQLPIEYERDLHRAIGGVARHCAGRPMLSFAVCRRQLVEVAGHWRTCIAPEVPGIEAPLLRFADTRVAAVLPDCLEPANWVHFSAPLVQWWSVDRAGCLVELLPSDGRRDGQLPKPKDFKLSDEEVNRLIHASMPDTLVQTMIEQLPELVPGDRRVQFYELMSEVVERAEKCAIDAYPDVYALAVFAAIAGREALGDEVMTKLLQAKDWPQGELAKRLMDRM